MKVFFKEIQGIQLFVALGPHPKQIDESLLQKFKSYQYTNPFLRKEPKGQSLPAKLAWLGSRICLDFALQRSGLQSERAMVSVSHGRVASAAVVASTECGMQIGVDIEESGRVISDEVLLKFQSDPGEVQLLSRIQLWCVKEACYKSELGAGKSLVHYRVQSFDRATQTGLVQSPTKRIHFHIFQYENHEIAVALV